MNIDLAALTRRTNPGIRRKAIPFRDIAPPATLATNLYRAVYAPVITQWTSAADRIVAEYERTISALTQDSPADVGAEINANASILDRLLILLTPEVRDWALRAERWQRGKWIGAALAASGVDLTTMLGVEDVRGPLATHIEWNVALVRDVSDQIRKRIGDAVFDGLRNRTPAREVAKTINEAVGLGRKRSLAIASDQLSKLTSSLADERRRQAGIDYWRWRHSGKRHPRETHKVRDGNIYADESAGVGKEIDGKPALAPPDVKDRPGAPPYCGCRSQAVLVLE